MQTNIALTEEVKEKWAPLLDESSLPKIENQTVRNTTLRILENTAQELQEVNTVGTAQVPNAYDPVLISLVRRSMPSLIAHDIVGVQPMTGPSGLIFTMVAHYGGDASGAEAFGTAVADVNNSGDGAGAGMSTAAAEVLGANETGNAAGTYTQNEVITQLNPWAEMSFSIEKATVTAKTRALKAKYTEELAADLKAVHGLDAETELANILSGELVAEINREVIALCRGQAIVTPAADYDGGGTNALTTLGEFDLHTDSDALTEIDRIRSLMLFINNQANRIARETRRGMANWIITSPNVAGALDLAGKMDIRLGSSLAQVSTPADVGITFAGVLNGRYKVFVDPYLANDEVLMGYKGANVYDAGAYYAPYIPMSMHKTVGEEDFQPRIGFKTRYGLAVNPFADTTNYSADPAQSLAANPYFRRFVVKGL